MSTKQYPLFTGVYASSTAHIPSLLPENEQPYKRVLRDGANACNTLELLMTLIGGKQAERIARELLARYQSLTQLSRAPAQELAGFAGIGESTAIRLKSALELSRRLLTPDTERFCVRTPGDAAQLLMQDMGPLEQEEIRVVLLDTRNRVIAIPMVYRGSLNAASLRVCELFREAIRRNAATIVMTHNHPSGDPTPSAEDIRVTRTLIEAGKLLDIELLDHLIITTHRYVSLKERGLAFGEER